MNLDIQTQHVLMRPEWHRLIDEWLARCAPAVAAVDLTLRHAEHAQPGEQVDALARSGGRTLRSAARAERMTDALHDALAALERELATLRGPEGERHRAA